MSIGCKIVKDFQRPAPELVTRFKDMPVANIDDNMGRIAAVDAAIEPIGYKGQLLGTAFTVRVPQGDNLMFHAAMDLAKPGDVIVIDAGGFTDRAIFGELMATYCKARGIKGIVCDGAIRDRGGLAAMEDFHVYARSATPNGPYKNGPGEINVPVVIGGKLVRPGDIEWAMTTVCCSLIPPSPQSWRMPPRRLRRKKPTSWPIFWGTAPTSVPG